MEHEFDRVVLKPGVTYSRTPEAAVVADDGLLA